MEEIKFDFNNMFSFSIGKDHGVEDSEVKELSADIDKAQAHLSKVISDKRARVKLSLEWTQLPLQESRLINEIQRIGTEIAEKYDNIVSLGIGGSYLGLKAAQEALCPAYYNEFSALRKGGPKIYFEGNNLDPDTLSVLLDELNPRKTFCIVISKSGETTETKAAFMVVENWLKQRVGKNYGRQIFAITDPESGSLRKKVNQEQAKDALSYRSLPLLKGVGGRYSELNMGLLHLAIIGVDIREVFKGAKAMAARCMAEELYENPAYMYAVLHRILYRKKGKDIAILMPFSESLKSTADWYIQLLAESLGKKYARRIAFTKDGAEDWDKDVENILNTGRTPAAFCGTNDLHSIQQNNIEGENNKTITFIKVEKFRNEIKIPAGDEILTGKKFSDLIKLAQEATEWALVRESRPNCTIIMPSVSPYHWGALLYFFEMATAFEGELANVNAFDQPGVEGYKNYMYYKLNKAGMPDQIANAIKDNPLIKDKKYII